MSWTDQTPEANDVLLQGRVLINGKHVCFEIDAIHGDKKPIYRATVGNLFGSQEVHRCDDLDHLLRWFYRACDK